MLCKLLRCKCAESSNQISTFQDFSSPLCYCEAHQAGTPYRDTNQAEARCMVLLPIQSGAGAAPPSWHFWCSTVTEIVRCTDFALRLKARHPMVSAIMEANKKAWTDSRSGFLRPIQRKHIVWNQHIVPYQQIKTRIICIYIYTKYKMSC